MDAHLPQDVRQERVRSSRVVLSRQCRGQPPGQEPGGTVAKKLVRRGDHGAAVSPLRRECRVISAYLCWPRVRLFLFARKAVGASCTRHSLRPRAFESEG